MRLYMVYNTGTSNAYKCCRLTDPPNLQRLLPSVFETTYVYRLRLSFTTRHCTFLYLVVFFLFWKFLIFHHILWKHVSATNTLTDLLFFRSTRHAFLFCYLVNTHILGISTDTKHLERKHNGHIYNLNLLLQTVLVNEIFNLLPTFWQHWHWGHE